MTRFKESPIGRIPAHWKIAKLDEIADEEYISEITKALGD